MKLIMLMVNKNKRLLPLLLLAVLGGMLLPILTPVLPKASADVSGQAIDRSTIKVGEQIFFDSDIDSTFKYQEVNPSDNCADFIDDFNNDDFHPGKTPAHATIHIGTIPSAGSSACSYRTERINFTSRDNFLLSFAWVQGGDSITTTDGKTTFKLSTDFANTFTTDSVKPGEGKCQDTIVVASNRAGSLVVREGADTRSRQSLDGGVGLGGANGQGHYDFHPFRPTEANPKYSEQTKCIETNSINVRIAGTPEAGHNGGASISGSISGSSGGQAEESCESEGGSMSWIICPLIFLGDQMIQALDSALTHVLEVPNDYFENPQLEIAWKRLRGIAYAILIPIMLVMVISTALGFEFISAYTVKKALPRLIAAVLFIALSFEICKFLIILTNNIGGGIHGLITGAFAGDSDITLAQVFHPDGRNSGIAVLGLTIGVAAVAAVASIGIIFSYLFVLLIGLAIGFFLLSLRQMLLIALLLLAPLAILAWIFPGNDKLWKIWWGTFSKLLLLYPLVMVLIASGKSFAVLVDSTDGSLVSTLIKVIAYVGPYFFIPAAFKFAGGIFANIAGMANDRGKGLFDRQRKYRGRKMGENWGKTRNYSRFSDRNRFTRGLNSILGAGTNPRDVWNGNVAAGRQTGRINQGQAHLKDDATWNAHQNDDNFLLSIADEELAQQKINEARANMNNTTLSDAERSAAQAEYIARQSAMDNARRVTSRKSAGTRLTALNALAKTGYQFSAGEAGYQELSKVVASIAGPVGSGAYNTAMNEAQYHAKTAGRFDLGGINHGDRYSVESGLSKASLYQLANGKKESITAMGAHYSTVMNEAASGVATNPDGTTRTLSASEINDRYMQAAIADKEIEAMLPNATGAVRDELLKQQAALRGAGGKEYQDWQGRDSGETIDVRDPATGGIMKKQLKMSEIASRRARTYERPDPNKIT